MFACCAQHELPGGTTKKRNGSPPVRIPSAAAKTTAPLWLEIHRYVPGTSLFQQGQRVLLSHILGWCIEYYYNLRHLCGRQGFQVRVVGYDLQTLAFSTAGQRHLGLVQHPCPRGISVLDGQQHIRMTE